MELTKIFTTAFDAVAPIILLILLGYYLRQKKFFSEDFVKIGNKLVFNVCLPCMLFVNVYEIEGFSSIQWDIVIYSVAVIAVIFVLGLAVSVAATPVPQRRGVLLQCSFRSNFAVIGLSLAAALGGDEAEAVAAVISAFTIPVFNILAVISLSIFVGEEAGKKSFKSILMNIIKNPLIIGVVLGLLCVAYRSAQLTVYREVRFSLKTDMKFFYDCLTKLKAIASPFALLVLGGQFTFSAVKGMFKEIAVGTVFRLVIAPAIGIGGAVLLTDWKVLSCGVNEFPSLIALFGSPVAVSSAVMAGAMHNDEQLATQLVVWTSICSILTIFLQVCLLMAAGLLAV
ncbi:MAG: AEC family transporter [Faecousia sp.]